LEATLEFLNTTPGEAILIGTTLLLALATVPGSMELVWLTVGALLPQRPLGGRQPHRCPALAVVVPAHNEERYVARCVGSLLACKAPAASFQVIVVADNCSDATAHRARGAGARVLVRDDARRRGKGYALQHAFDLLMREGFDAFVVVDADSVVAANFVEQLAAEIAAGADAVQAPYGVLNPSASLRARLMRVALLAFNRFRLRGRAGWGVSAGILGNGFALTRATLHEVPYAAHSIVEDLEYHLRLVRAGRKVRFASRTHVLADMPIGETAAASQRARWEGGRFRMIGEHCPKLLGGVLRGKWALAEPLLELLLLPLAFHVALLVAALASPLAVVQLYSVCALAVVAVHVVFAVIGGGGGWRDLAALAAAPFYVAWKVVRLPASLRNARGGSEWVRTAREARRGVCS
jgi:cellulose synthase/poly-beta-1,6-N-acetylglucosamine synthase-like glycosyltransferase